MKSRTRLRPKLVGPKLLTIRRHLGLSQSKMKERINFPGPYGCISEFELGKRFAPPLVLLSYARVVNVPLEHILDDAIELTL